MKILLCTVGGSYQPILTAIKGTKPDYVCFFCTEGSSGSMSLVTGAGLVIKKSFDDEKPTLRNIPTQASLSPKSFEAVAVPADDLDGVYSAICAAITDLRKKYPGADFIADYTGGTKTMSAALICVGLENQIELQLVTSTRTNLFKVETGAEHPMVASVEHISFNREMELHLAAWKRFAYREAETGLQTIRIGVQSPDRDRLETAKTLSNALALWDDFNHQKALSELGRVGKIVRKHYSWMFGCLAALTKETGKDSEPARLIDLWLNAERRAAQGRFDDAVARTYRLIEWTAQWQLKTKCKLDTADFPECKLPEGSNTKPDDSDGKIKIGLLEAWQVILGTSAMGDVQQFAEKEINTMKNLLQIRNYSILAHGFSPVTQEEWQEIKSWMDEAFLPMLYCAARNAGLKDATKPRQLPTEPPESLL